jgi:glyoxylase-like metal-dependent hydrolase (beta-lactamase superfamily II)
LAGAGEWDFWRGVTNEELAAFGPHPEAVQAPLENRIESVADGETIAPGVNAVAMPGHTPGHCSVVISSGAERAVILGDAVVCPLQFDERDLTFLFDVDQTVARQTRERIFAELEGNPQTVVAGMHYPDAVFGRVVPGQGKRWVSFPNRTR